MLEASALDPRFKSLPYITDDQRNEVFNRLVDRVHNINATKVIHCYFILKKKFLESLGSATIIWSPSNSPEEEEPPVQKTTTNKTNKYSFNSFKTSLSNYLQK